jgi:hypothetical protein
VPLSHDCPDLHLPVVSLPSTSAASVSRAGRFNRAVGWTSLVVGALTGLVMGLWSFAGPVAVPEWLGDYDHVSRRLARLGHIAFFGLGILNLLVASELPRMRSSALVRRTAAATMNFGNALLPLSLFAAAAWHPLKYFMPIPAVSVAVALALVAGDVWRRSQE